jgi:peptidoglycan/xylan/chitin deacetylase (PgdA/CDA1 family)
MQKIILSLLMALTFMCGLGYAQSGGNNPPDLKQIVKDANTKAQQLIDYGNLLLEKGETEKAFFHFQQASKAAPYDYRSFWAMIRFYMNNGKFDEAYKIMEQAGVFHQDNNTLYQLVDELDQKLYQETAKDSSVVVRIANFKDDKKCAVSFNFDDGAKQVYTSILPIFEQYGFKATIPINPTMVSKDSINPVWASWEDLQDAHKRGFEIANHSLAHLDLTLQSEERLEREVNYSYDLIEQKLTFKPHSFIFPFNKSHVKSLGKVMERHIAIRHHNYLKQVYPHIFLAIYGGDYFSNKTAERIINMAMRRNLWLTVEAHSVKTEIPTYKPLSKEFLHEHLQYLNNKTKDVWVDTFGNVYRYLALKKNSKVEIIESTSEKVVFRLNSQLDPNVYNIPLTVIVRSDIKDLDNLSVYLENSKENLPFIIKNEVEVQIQTLLFNQLITIEGQRRN